MREARGDLEGALAAYTRALDIAEQLVRADPSTMALHMVRSSKTA